MNHPDPASSPPPRAKTMARLNSVGLARFRRLALKELRETLRDRRTIITLVLMPLIVYPLLSIAFQKFLLTGLTTTGVVDDILIGVESEEAMQLLRSFLAMGDGLVQRNSAIAAKSPEASGVSTPGALSRISQGPSNEPISRIHKLIPVPDVSQAVKDGEVDLGIRIRKIHDFDLPTPYRKAVDCELVVLEDTARSRIVLRHVQRVIAAINDEYIDRRLRQLRLAQEARPIRAAVIEVEDSRGPVSYTLASLVPLVLILMTITGAVYPAIDVTAGERERGTLEALVAAPVPRLGLLLAKYVAVLTVAVLTAGANMLAMTATVLATGLGGLLFGKEGLTIPLIGEVFGLLILFAMFFSAVLLAVTSFARSFKEAQAYLIPLMLVSIAPGLLSMMPELNLNRALAVTPLLNIVLLARDLFERTTDPALTVAVILSTALYAVAAIALAARIFGTDAILYGSMGTWSDLFRLPRESRPAPTVASAMMCLAIIFPSYFLLGHGLASLSDLSKVGQLVLSSLVTVTVFGAFPLVVAALNRLRITEAFQLRSTAWPYFVASVVLGSSLWAFAFESVIVTHSLFGQPEMSEERRQLIEKLLHEFAAVSPAMLAISLAVVPAIAEELCFRGYLLSAFRARRGDLVGILVSGGLFGLFHLIVEDMFAFERFLPSTLLGLVLGWICVKTGSVFPGMVVHACHNGLVLVLVGFYQKRVADADVATQTLPHLPTIWLVAAGVGAIVGFAIFWLTAQRRAKRA